MVKPTAKPAEPAQPLSLRQRQKARTRDELLEAALRTFSDVGFGLATIEDIAARAGASKGTVYAHFPDGRDGLFRAVYADLSGRTLARARALHDEADDVVSRVVALAQALLEMSSDPHVGAFFSIEGPALGQALGPVLGRASGEYTAILVEDLSRARDEGLLLPGAEPDILAALIVGAMRAAGVVVSRSPDQLPALVDAIAQVTRGVLVPSAR